MIIDLILNRRDDDEYRAQGYTHVQNMNGKLEEIRYDPHEFYVGVFRYIGLCADDAARKITEAMDYGDEEDVRRELCAYIIDYGYNPAICEYVNSREWLEVS